MMVEGFRQILGVITSEESDDAFGSAAFMDILEDHGKAVSAFSAAMGLIFAFEIVVQNFDPEFSIKTHIQELIEESEG
jgi:hypothetical protein